MEILKAKLLDFNNKYKVKGMAGLPINQDFLCDQINFILSSLIDDLSEFKDQYFIEEIPSTMNGDLEEVLLNGDVNRENLAWL